MSKLPQVKPTELLRFFQKHGFVITRQVGSHARLVDADGRKITLAVHNKPLAIGTFNAILKQAAIDKKDFIKLFKKK